MTMTQSFVCSSSIPSSNMLQDNHVLNTSPHLFRRDPTLPPPHSPSIPLCSTAIGLMTSPCQRLATAAPPRIDTNDHEQPYDVTVDDSLQMSFFSSSSFSGSTFSSTTSSNTITSRQHQRCEGSGSSSSSPETFHSDSPPQSQLPADKSPETSRSRLQEVVCVLQIQ